MVCVEVLKNIPVQSGIPSHTGRLISAIVNKPDKSEVINQKERIDIKEPYTAYIP